MELIYDGLQQIEDLMRRITLITTSNRCSLLDLKDLPCTSPGAGAAGMHAKILS
jgi:hypothetical protein